MPISVPCPGCGAKLKAPDAAAGRILNCPGCLTPVQMPLAASAAPPPVPPAAPPTAFRSGPAEVHKKTGHADPPLIDDDELPKLKDEEDAPKLKDDDVYDDFEVVEDDADALDEVLPVSSAEEVLDSVIEVPEAEALDSLEEVESVDQQVQDEFSWSRVLRLSVIHVRGQKGSLADGFTRQDERAYDLCDPHARKRVGEALELRTAEQQVARFFVDRNLLSSRLELREGREGDLLAVVRRPPYLLGQSLEVVDADDRVLGQFERMPFALITQQTLWIKSSRDRKLLRLKADIARWRIVFQTVEGQFVGEMITEGAYRGGGARLRWFAKGSSYFVRFMPKLDNRPRDKLLFLAVSMGLEL